MAGMTKHVIRAGPHPSLPAAGPGRAVPGLPADRAQRRRTPPRCTGTRGSSGTCTPLRTGSSSPRWPSWPRTTRGWAATSSARWTARRSRPGWERDRRPRLRGRYPEPPAQAPQEQWTADQRKARAIHHRDADTPAEVAARYPSHLHIDIVPRLQSGGNGRRLMTALTSALREQGSPGVHLGVHAENTRAIGFYRHVGFTQVPFDDGAVLAAMDLR